MNNGVRKTKWEMRRKVDEGGWEGKTNAEELQKFHIEIYYYRSFLKDIYICIKKTLNGFTLEQMGNAFPRQYRLSNGKHNARNGLLLFELLVTHVPSTPNTMK